MRDAKIRKKLSVTNIMPVEYIILKKKKNTSAAHKTKH